MILNVDSRGKNVYILNRLNDCLPFFVDKQKLQLTTGEKIRFTKKREILD